MTTTKRFCRMWNVGCGMLIVLLFTSNFPQSATAETYILPARLDLGFAVPTVSMPKSDYTNCVFWMDASAPVSDAGTTNFVVPDLSPARNDATQPATNSQPPVVDGAFVFDGSDGSGILFDSITLDFSKPWKMSCTVYSDNWIFGNKTRAFWTGTSGAGRIYIGSGDYLKLNAADYTTYAISSALPRDTWVDVTLDYDGTNTLVVAVNGTETSTTIPNTATMTLNSWGGQKRGSSVQEFYGKLRDAKIIQ